MSYGLGGIGGIGGIGGNIMSRKNNNDGGNTMKACFKKFLVIPVIFSFVLVFASFSHAGIGQVSTKSVEYQDFVKFVSQVGSVLGLLDAIESAQAKGYSHEAVNAVDAAIAVAEGDLSDGDRADIFGAILAASTIEEAIDSLYVVVSSIRPTPSVPVPPAPVPPVVPVPLVGALVPAPPVGPPLTDVIDQAVEAALLAAGALEPAPPVGPPLTDVIDEAIEAALLVGAFVPAPPVGPVGPALTDVIDQAIQSALDVIAIDTSVIDGVIFDALNAAFTPEEGEAGLGQEAEAGLGRVTGLINEALQATLDVDTLNRSIIEGAIFDALNVAFPSEVFEAGMGRSEGLITEAIEAALDESGLVISVADRHAIDQAIQAATAGIQAALEESTLDMSVVEGPIVNALNAVFTPEEAEAGMERLTEVINEAIEAVVEVDALNRSEIEEALVDALSSELTPEEAKSGGIIGYVFRVLNPYRMMRSASNTYFYMYRNTIGLLPYF